MLLLGSLRNAVQPPGSRRAHRILSRLRNVMIMMIMSQTSKQLNLSKHFEVTDLSNATMCVHGHCTIYNHGLYPKQWP